MASWNPALYLSFAGERTRPAAELLARIVAPAPGRVVDLGCGPGNSTALLAARWPQARLEGIDNSAAMLNEARASGIPAQWIETDITAWSPEAPYDVIFSNATFQWLEGQEVLLPRLMQHLSPGGVFAFQVPANFHAPSHVLMRELARQPRWAERLKNVRNIVPGSAQGYYDMLAAHAASLDIWQTDYLQVLEGDDPVYRFVSATGLRPFLEALSGQDRDDFIAAYKALLAEAYPRRADGKTLFPFQRLFAVAVGR
ncbi:MAG TPA: trans-aconitate 2-methyltransferase [Rhizomicrobium sp.]|nr:trans-aconitate 2-methyltransferase [Rhizomicrobium sp.]